MKIYDCFTFNNELDLLEIRLRELYNIVDYFVIVEGAQTFQGNDKPLHYQNNKERFAQWADKIRHYVLSDMPVSANPWDKETAQRNALMQGTFDAAPDDLVIISDADEIARPDAIEYMRNSDAPVFGLRMALFNFKFNYMRVTPGEYDVWAMAARKAVMDQVEPDQLRNMRFGLNTFAPWQSTDGFQVVEHAGWHFGYLGNRDYLIDKAKSFSHHEVNTPEFIAQIDIDASIRERKEWNRNQTARYEIVELDSYFPKTITQNTAQYGQYILDEPVTKPLALLPDFPYNT